MCGIVGMAGDLEYSDKAIFRDLLDVCQIRGRDGTGVIRVNLKDEVVYDKQIGPPNLLVDNDSYKRIIDNGLSKVLIGHCRLKTMGDMVRANTHPFQFQHITGVHNGTLKSMWDLDRRSDFDVDSAALYYNIAQDGVENVIPKVSGAWALVWWDDAEGTLNFLRNDERPLWLTWSEDFRKLYWASERWMFGAIARKSKMWDGGEDKAPYIELPPDSLWSFQIDASAKKEERVFQMKAVRKIEGKKWGGVAQGNFPKHTPGNTGPGNKDKGGSNVNNPFIVDDLDDPIPEGLFLLPKPPADATPNRSLLVLTPSQEESTHTNSSFKNVLNRSSTPSENKQDTKPSKSSSTKESSLILPSLKISQSDNKGDTLKRCDAKPDSVTYNTRLVSVRKCAGMEYITDNKTKVEWHITGFEANTNSRCCYCHEPIGDLTEVYEFFDEGKRFMCTSCADEPEPSLKEMMM